MMQRDMPGAFATLRESAQDDALVIDLEALLDRGDGLEHVHFASPMPAGAVDASKTIELYLALVGDVSLAFGRKKIVDELGFSGRVLPAVQPDVKSRGFAGIIIRRQRHAVGEHCAINFRIVRMYLPPALIPLRLIGLEFFAAFDPLIERVEGMFDGGLISKHIGIFQKHVTGVRENLNISHQFRRCATSLQIPHLGVNLRGFFPNPLKLLRRGLDGWWCGSASPLAVAARTGRRSRWLGYSI